MADVMKQLGAAGPVAMVGYVFDGAGPNATMRRSIASLPQPVKQRKSSPIRRPNGNGSRPVSAYRATPHWRSIASATSRAFRGRPLAEEVADARALYRVLADIGGTDLVGPARELDPGTFYTAGTSE